MAIAEQMATFDTWGSEVFCCTSLGPKFPQGCAGKLHGPPAGPSGQRLNRPPAPPSASACMHAGQPG
ncbi:MAG TPA: hypothetical protein VLB04_02395 [Methanotrichaceae archaeon]|nr:hypothetical protein [Methanotrichaceae archaeon]